MKLREMWNNISALSKTAMIISNVCLVVAISNLFFRSKTVTIVVDSGLIMALILDFLVAVRGEARARKLLEISEFRRRELMFMCNRVETRLIGPEKESWNALEIQSVFLYEREKYLKEIEE